MTICCSCGVIMHGEAPEIVEYNHCESCNLIDRENRLREDVEGMQHEHELIKRQEQAEPCECPFKYDGTVNPDILAGLDEEEYVDLWNNDEVDLWQDLKEDKRIYGDPTNE